MDILGPLVESISGNKYILAVIDQYTTWIECYPLPSMKADTIAKVAIENFFAKFGCPLQIHTDQWKKSDGQLFHELCKLLEIDKIRTTPYRPCSNGQVERYNSPSDF